VSILNAEKVQNMPDSEDNDVLIKAYLMECLYHTKIKGQPISKGKVKRVEIALNNIQKALNCDTNIKAQNCAALLGSLTEGGQYVDTILIDTLIAIARYYHNEEGIASRVTAIVQDVITMKLPNNSLL
jgi:hypothetical protein